MSIRTRATFEFGMIEMKHWIEVRFGFNSSFSLVLNAEKNSEISKCILLGGAIMEFWDGQHCL